MAETPVLLDDQFQSGEVKLGEITRLCTPVSKNRESIPSPGAHLVCYAIVDGTEFEAPVSAFNQIETVARSPTSPTSPSSAS